MSQVPVGQVRASHVREGQLRFVYSMLKPAVRAAARFHVPIRTVSELLRLGYFEHLRRTGLTQAQIAQRMGQTDRHMRSLARRLRGDFFAAEDQVGIVREVEDRVAAAGGSATLHQLAALLPHADGPALAAAVQVLLDEGRIERGADATLHAPARYHVLASDQFHHRIDALNHFLDGAYRAVVQRLIHDDRETAMVKAITFTAVPEALHQFMQRFEGELRREIAALEEDAAFKGQAQTRFTLGITLAPLDPEPPAKAP